MKFDIDKAAKKSVRAVFYETPILPLLIIVFAGACLFIPNFATAYNLKNVLLQSADILIIACGVTFVVLNGGIDFSATSILTLGSVVGAYIMALSPLASTPAISIPAAIIVMAGMGVVIGAINGFSVTVLKIPSFIATLATQLAVSGIAVFFTSTVSDKASISGLPEAFFVLGGTGKFFFVPVAISLLIWGFSHWLLKYSVYGRRIYAIGVNPKASFISGISVKKTIFAMMVLSGLFAGIASVIATARNQVGVSSLGDKMFITIIASIIVGGNSTSGGFGGFKHTLYGVLFITILNNTMNLLGVEWYVIMIIQGLLIVVAAMMDYVLNKRRKTN